MHGNDYYGALGVAEDAAPEEIKKAYRRMALETHPDRNPGDPTAEERFKRVNEAYGVLSDAGKRSQYDMYRRMGGEPGRAAPGAGFGFTQEDIFRDLFSGGPGRDIFEDLRREFSRMGFRFDDRFVNDMFFGRGGNAFFQGFMWGGPGGGVRVFRSGAGGEGVGPRPFEPPREEKKKGFLGWVGGLLAKGVQRLAGYVLRKVMGLDVSGSRGEAASAPSAEGDVAYELRIPADLALTGAVVSVELPHLEGARSVSIRIPPGAGSGTRVRLRGLGNPDAARPEGRGDVYVTLRCA